MSPQGLLVPGSLLLVLAACRSFEPPPPELLAAIAAQAPPADAAWRGRARIAIESRRLRGEYEALLVASTSPEPRARLQLWPELGGKLLDVVARPDRIQGRFAGGVLLDVEPAAAPREFLVIVALTLLEHVAPLDPARVRGVRRSGDAWEADVRPVASPLDLRVRLDGQGRILERHFRFRRATWVETPGRGVRASSFALTVRSARSHPAAELPAGIFELR